MPASAYKTSAWNSISRAKVEAARLVLVPLIGAEAFSYAQRPPYLVKYGSGAFVVGCGAAIGMSVTEGPLSMAFGAVGWTVGTAFCLGLPLMFHWMFTTSRLANAKLSADRPAGLGTSHRTCQAAVLAGAPRGAARRRRDRWGGWVVHPRPRAERQRRCKVARPHPAGEGRSLLRCGRRTPRLVSELPLGRWRLRVDRFHDSDTGSGTYSAVCCGRRVRSALVSQPVSSQVSEPSYALGGCRVRIFARPLPLLGAVRGVHRALLCCRSWCRTRADGGLVYAQRRLSQCQGPLPQCYRCGAPRPSLLASASALLASGWH